MNENLKRVIDFLEGAGTYYLATVENDQPRVRPFGSALLFENKLYILTGKTKEVSKQLSQNPKAEICAYHDGKWLRVCGELINDENRAVKTAILEKMPSLRAMYQEDDGNMQMLFFKNATATFSSFTEPQDSIKF